ncbi:efflux RND transporter periplasmic adaptor subunit [Stieleria sp. TO1_6]|uniref:efflux RND transporter periplasmic adaptor subunit n=1 Tax=Stieleria tagensis TaxID=2956795 RepID=UPI00209AE429|nr:efflux RND transporter periplasmic adaptor subunit [Stieleria tagensis]MCO8124189.1 efflux RND transporter periplasmic adaptor subunit [Stieleria tagensis]
MRVESLLRNNVWLGWLFSLLISASGCDRLKSDTDPSQQPPPAPPLVDVIKAQMTSVQPKFTVPGVIESIENSRLRPRVSATVIERTIIPGKIVAKDELLYKLDDSDYVLALKQAESKMAQAQANLTDANGEWERAQRLKEKDAIALADYDAAKAAAQVAAATIMEIESEIDRAKLDQQRTEIHAPFAGKISVAGYAKGDYVTPSSPDPLCEIVRLDPIYGTAQVNQDMYFNYLSRHEELEAAGQDIPDLVLDLLLPSGKPFAHQGVFENWDNAATASTGTISARIRFPNPDGTLLPGTNVILSGSMIFQVQRVVVPQAAVGQDQQGHYVMVVDENSVVQRKNVDVGLRIESNWAIRSGLDEGEQVIVQGLQKVRPGVTVQVRSEPQSDPKMESPAAVPATIDSPSRPADAS